MSMSIPTPPEQSSLVVPTGGFRKWIVDLINTLTGWRNVLIPPVGGNVYDTGWITVALAGGFTATSPVQVRRIGRTIYWRGRVQRDAGAFIGGTQVNIIPAGGVPSWATPSTTYTETFATTTNGAGNFAHAAVDTAGAVALRPVEASNNYGLKPLSGYVVG